MPKTPGRTSDVFKQNLLDFKIIAKYECNTSKLQQLQMQHLFVLRIVIKAHNGHSIVKLERERIHTVVDQYDIPEIALVEYSHVFDVEVWVARPNAARSEVSRLDKRAIRVQIVNNRICVLLLRSCENDNLEVLVGCFETLSSERTNVDAGENGLRLLAKLDRNYNVWILCLDVVHAVNQGLIKVEHDRLCLGWVIRFRKVNEQVLDVLKRRHG